MSHTIELPEELYVRLEMLAQDKGQTVQDMATQVLQATLAQGNATGSSDTPLATRLSFVGILGEPEIAPEPGWIERHDEIIADEAMDPHAEE